MLDAQKPKKIETQDLQGEAPPWILDAPDELLASARRLLRGSMAQLGVEPGAALAEIVPAALDQFREVEEDHSRQVAQQLVGHSPHLGAGAVLRALAQHRAKTVALSVRAPWQTNMLHEDSVWLAKRAGDDVEIVNDCAALAGVGGIACL